MPARMAVLDSGTAVEAKEEPAITDSFWLIQFCAMSRYLSDEVRSGRGSPPLCIGAVDPVSADPLESLVPFSFAADAFHAFQIACQSSTTISLVG